MGIIDKMKEKLHIGDDKDPKSTGTTGSHATGAGTHATGAGGAPVQTASGATYSHPGGSGKEGPGATYAHPGVGQQNPDATYAHPGPRGAPGSVATGAATSGAGAGHTNTGSNVAAQSTGVHSTSSQGTTPTGVHATHGSTTSQATNESVTIHERDPNWQKARDLTTGAEHQSKVSAAKAYEAEAFLVGATESHEQAQAALNAKANLVAQAEAEKRNIGQADYIHREFDHAKKVQEDREKHVIEINKNVDQTKKLVAAKEGELNAVLPAAQQQAAAIEQIQSKLGSIQEAKVGLEQKEAQNAQKLRELESQKGQFAGQIQALEANVANLTKRADELELQAKQARQEATAAASRLKDLRGSVSAISRDQDKAARSVDALQKDLEAYKQKEADLAEKLQAAKAAAAAAADAAAAKEAELQLARQQYEAERAKGAPVEKEIEKYRKQVQEKEHQLTEAQQSSKAAKAAYEKFMSQANEADAEYKKALAEKERKLSTYNENKQAAELANARATEMWNQAKKFGNTGDANALQRLAEAEKTLQEESAPVTRELVTPNVGIKQPTTEGPKFTRTEDAKESNSDVQEEKTKTKVLA